MPTGARSPRALCRIGSKAFAPRRTNPNSFRTTSSGRQNGLVLPTGISSLRGMKRYLRQQTDALGQEVDFDKLPIPFRAIATDLSTGDSVTLGRGDLVSAALASMAVPGLYPSQRIDGRTLIDGGMSKQVPIDVARKWALTSSLSSIRPFRLEISTTARLQPSRRSCSS